MRSSRSFLTFILLNLVLFSNFVQQLSYTFNLLWNFDQFTWLVTSFHYIAINNNRSLNSDALSELRFMSFNIVVSYLRKGIYIQCSNKSISNHLSSFHDTKRVYDQVLFTRQENNRTCWLSFIWSWHTLFVTHIHLDHCKAFHDFLSCAPSFFRYE